MQKVKVEQIKDAVKVGSVIWVPMEVIEIDTDYKWPITVHHSGENQTVNLHLIDTVCIEEPEEWQPKHLEEVIVSKDGFEIPCVCIETQTGTVFVEKVYGGRITGGTAKPNNK